MKRLTIYALYDPDGLVEDYVVDCVAAMSEHSDRVLVVSNGALTAGSADRLTVLPSVELVERANEGFDIWGYKHGLERVGWDELERYDEVVLMNSTIAGPLYPLSEMFAAMEARDLDFWGLTAHAGEDYDPWDMLPTGRIERHIQSYFTAVRKPMLRSVEFREYWDSLPLIRSYTEAVALHEAVFTHKFQQLGLRWACYVDGTDLEGITSYPLMFLPERVLIEKRCPFFKRKALFLEAPDLAATHATSTAAMVACLDRLGYDLDRVLPSVIRTSHQCDVRLALNAFETLSSPPEDRGSSLSKVRVIARVKDIESCLALERFRAVLEQCGSLVILADQSLEDPILSRLRDFTARVVTGAQFPDFVREVGHGAQTDDHLLLFGSTGDGSQLGAYTRYEIGLRALVESEATLASAVVHLEQSIVAGALASPHTSIRLDIRAADWREAGAPLATVLPMLGIDVPLSRDKPAWGPFGGTLLARQGMLATDWDVIADAMASLPERKAEELFTSLIPFILQSHRRLLVFALPETMTGPAVFANHLQQALQTASLRRMRESALRSARVYHNSGAGYIEDEAVVVRPTRSNGVITFSWHSPAEVHSVRFDPVEGVGVVCRGATATVDGTAVEIVPVNCLRFGSIDVFMTTDPIYDVRGVKPGATVVVTMEAISYLETADFAPRFAEDDDLATYGGPLTPTLTTIRDELTDIRNAHDAMCQAHDAVREAHDALREVYDGMLEVRVRRRLHPLVAWLRARVPRAPRA